MAKTKLKAWAMSGRVPGACGVGVIVNHRLDQPTYLPWGSSTRTPDRTFFQMQDVRYKGGAGWTCSGFIDSKESHAVYADMTTLYGPPVFQTPVRNNRTGSSKFFFAVWDTDKKVK